MQSSRRRWSTTLTCGALMAVGALTLAACGGAPSEPSPASSSNSATATPEATFEASSGASPEGAAAAAGEASVEAGIPYASTSPTQTLDLYLPADASEPIPLVVLIHGGAFMMGDSSMEAAKAQALVRQGFAVASLNYRLSGEALFPAGAQDVKAAVRYLRANADQYGIDPGRFAAWGSSAGGWLANMLGVTGDETTIFDDPALGNPDVSSAVQAVVSWFGPTNFTTMDEQAADVTACAGQSQVHGTADSPESAWLGGALTDVPEVTALTDLAAYLSRATTIPPYYFAHGDADCNVPAGQSQELAAALDEAGARQTVSIVAGAGHADPAIDAQETDPSILFIQQALGG